MNKREEIVGIFKFMLDMDDLTGTNIERRINQLLKQGEVLSTRQGLLDTVTEVNEANK